MLSEIEINDEIQRGNIFDPLTVLNGTFKVQSAREGANKFLI